MITGAVNDRLEAVVKLPASCSAGQAIDIKAVIDTGYNGILMLPTALVNELRLPYAGKVTAILADGSRTDLPLFRAQLIWDDQPMSITVAASGLVPLVGMELLEGHNLNIDVHPGGQVRINSAQAA